MFKNREFRVKMIKTPKEDQTVTEIKFPEPSKLKKTVIFGGACYTYVVGVRLARDVALLAAKNHFK